MAYTEERIQQIVANQRKFFRSGVTLDVIGGCSSSSG